MVDQTQILLFHTCLSNLLQETRNFHLPVKMESLSPILQRPTIGRHRTSSACHWPLQDLPFLPPSIGGESQTVRRLSTSEVLTPAPIHRVHGQKSQIRVHLTYCKLFTSSEDIERNKNNQTYCISLYVYENVVAIMTRYNCINHQGQNSQKAEN